MWGKSAWSKGQTKEINEKLMKASIKISKVKKELWLNLPEEEKDKKRKQWAMAGLKCPKKDTSIEKKMAKILDKLNMGYKRNFTIKRWHVDFFTENGKVIECQGDYWHCNPLKYKLEAANKIQLKNIKRDEEKKKYLIEQKIPFLFIWEKDIMDNSCWEGVKNFLCS